MTLSEKTIGELKSALLSEKEKLEKGLSPIARPVDQKDGEYTPTFEDIGTDREDNASEVEQYADNLPVELALENKLKDVIAALDKIEKGTYGICENCKQEIDPERLRANPSAKTCIECS